MKLCSWISWFYFTCGSPGLFKGGPTGFIAFCTTAVLRYKGNQRTVLGGFVTWYRYLPAHSKDLSGTECKLDLCRRRSECSSELRKGDLETRGKTSS